MGFEIIGTGYVGLVSSVCLSDFGHVVVFAKRDPAKITRLDRREAPIYEPGLEEVVAKNAVAGRLAPHRGGDRALLASRHPMYELARAVRPKQWSGRTRNWRPVGTVWLNPE